MIDKAIIDEVLARTNIENVISPYVSLKRAGNLMKGLCPFHSEKTPSFSVYTRDNSFYCFGCGVGGNAISFLKRVENLDFESAVIELGKRVGITVTRKDSEDAGPRVDRNRLLELNREAARYFHARLFDNTPQAAEARAYLTEKRKLSMSVIKHFGLGFAPNDPGGFLRYFKQKGYTEEELVTAFLCGKGERGCYLSFRDRVMFPIIDVTGNVIAFGGRVLDSSPQKYKNSSDTPVFKKSKNLYALNFARQSCAERLILCEGYMDVIAMHANGITNAVATLGTAITPEQARLMSHYTKKVILAYDSDEAGQKATARALSLLEPVGLSVQVLRIQGAKDPDEFLQKFGADAFRKMLDSSRSKFEFNMEKVLSKHDITVPQEKIFACAELCNVISGFYSKAEREIYISEVAKRLEMPANVIRGDVERAIGKADRQKQREQFEAVKQQTAGYGDRINPDRIKSPLLSNCENAVLSLMLLYPPQCLLAFSPAVRLTEEDFFTGLGKRIFAYLRDCSTDGVADVAALYERFTDEEISRITEIKVSRMDLSNNSDSVFIESVEALRRAMKAKQLEEGTTTLSDLESLVRGMRESMGIKNGKDEDVT